MGNRPALELESQEMVHHSEMRNLTPLVFPEDDSQYAPRTTAVPCLQVSCHLLPDTFQVSENIFSFKYDTLNRCKMTITPKVSATEMMNPERNRKTFDLGKGLGLEFFGWELNLSQTVGLNTNKTKEIEIKIESKEPIPHSEITNVVFKKNGEGFVHSIESQVVRYNGKNFLIKDLFGLPQGEERSECAVCLSNPRDTLILPCYHICLCASCANMLRVQTNKKCPLCRSGNYYTEAEGLLKLNFQDSI